MKNHKEFFQYVIPSMLAFALSGVYSIADGFFVGNAMGDSALAAINVAYPLTAWAALWNTLFPWEIRSPREAGSFSAWPFIFFWGWVFFSPFF